MSGSAAPIAWRHLFRTIRNYAPLWLGATIIFAGLGYSYTQVRRDTFAATQSLVIRNEAHSEQDLLGRFASQTDLKAAQETVMELANSRGVVLKAITQLGPDPNAPSDEPTAQPWPSQEDIEDARKRINVIPPKGSEFGATEVIYLETKESSQERSRQLCDLVREGLTEALRDVRAERFAGVIAELTHARDLAKERQLEANNKLQAMEANVGSDLGELRALTETYAGTGNLQRVITELQKESQLAELDLDKLRELETLLRRGQQDPDQLLVSGGELLASQPTLKRLKDGYIDAQLEASRLSSRYTPDHPKMRAAEAAQLEILEKIRLEIQASIDSMEPQIRVAAERVSKLKQKQQEHNQRLNELAEMRTAYSNLLSEFKHRTDLLERAETSLNEAEASRQAASSIDLISPLGPVQVGDKPVGPGDGMLLVGSATAGLLFGFGMVFLVAPGAGHDNYGRRWSDYSGSKLRQANDDSAAAQPITAEDSMRLVPETPPVSNEATQAWNNLRKLAGERIESKPRDPRVERRSNPR
ncbi:MAG: hypothetical protein R3C05_19410 [Pirellulaceae bacterium]